ncbi:AbrB/MazE/SpoVT family DNA-binding domain-containing protein [Bacillus atrophaeus]|uniref:Transition state regulatory protein n=1 Tax=Bacillus atrophaeus (strain 1942) TaxID=720555 RepID=A0ABN3ZHS1_BACA1|nr:AbrB/MazE/SpoVT family DNA-binding domain-containing protein [Bacillus atrophaeus]AMR60931.1 AbrB family transcriptional regulator [Bacillus subtilis subsp. globigii]ADP34413.1 transition state regulatory protein [Bacillus atrophaeus 1942]AIK49422.1 putative transition state regulator abh [Bacillus atrophaeus subsp. globigii]EIM11363.1 transition state regulatory protein [Bacillus atrophaeus C89]KFK82621.1 putative transition state regulator abh [Bacillus atrophaeus]
MKSTGVVRKVDELGRIVVPVEIRRQFDLKEKDPVEIFTEGDKVIFRRYHTEKSCLITGEISEQNRTFPGGIVWSPEGCQLVLNELEKQI